MQDTNNLTFWRSAGDSAQAVDGSASPIPAARAARPAKRRAHPSRPCSCPSCSNSPAAWGSPATPACARANLSRRSPMGRAGIRGRVRNASGSRGRANSPDRCARRPRTAAASVARDRPGRENAAQRAVDRGAAPGQEARETGTSISSAPRNQPARSARQRDRERPPRDRPGWPSPSVRVARATRQSNQGNQVLQAKVTRVAKATRVVAKATRVAKRNQGGQGGVNSRQPGS